MSFNQNNETKAWEDGVTCRATCSASKTLHARCCEIRVGLMTIMSFFIEYQLITIYSWIFIENCDLITENNNL